MGETFCWCTLQKTAELSQFMSGFILAEDPALDIKMADCCI